MICNSYNQLTIIEKTQFVGKLLHLVQSKESAFLIADNLLREAGAEGCFDKVIILPNEEPLKVFQEMTVSSETYQQSYELINSETFLASHSNKRVSSLFSKTMDSIQRSYQKIFTRLAS